jgi:Pentapeptide repeats (9 copies)
VPQCKYHEVCNRDVEGNSAEGLCILHSTDPAKDTHAFTEALDVHRERNGDRFTRFVFPEMVDFRMTTFRKGVDFNSATFYKGVNFNGASFGAEASFNGATFGAEVNFNIARLASQPLMPQNLR